MSGQLYPLEHFTHAEALEVERFGIFDDRPGYREDAAGGRVSVDVAALVAEAREMDAGVLVTKWSPVEMTFVKGPSIVARLADALEAQPQSRPVRPPREALARALHKLAPLWVHDNYGPDYYLDDADALLADADLWQPAPPASMAEYEALYYKAVEVVQALFAGAPTPGEVVRAIERVGWAPVPQPAPVIDRDALIDVMVTWGGSDSDRAWYAALADTLLPFFGQPASPRTVDRPEKPLREAMIDAGAFRNSPKRVVVKAVDQMLAAPDLWASPRTVTTVAELDALPVGSVIREKHGYILERLTGASRDWYRPGGGNFRTSAMMLPASVLYVPSAGVATECPCDCHLVEGASGDKEAA